MSFPLSSVRNLDAREVTKAFVFVFQAVLSILNTGLRSAAMAGSGHGGRGCVPSRSVLGKLGCSPVLVLASPARAIAACWHTAESSTCLGTCLYVYVEMYVYFVKSLDR